MFLKSKNRAALIDGCVRLMVEVVLAADVADQVATSVHLHGHSERDVRTVHRAVPPHVLVLPVFRGMCCTSSIERRY